MLRALAKRPRERYDDCASFARIFTQNAGAVAGDLDVTTARIAVPPMVDAPPAKSPRRRNPARAVGGGLYRTGGRVARRTGGLQRLLWRLALAFLVGNLLLAVLLYVDRGEVPGLIAGEATLGPGATARVTTDESRLRGGPSTDDEILVLLPLDQAVEISAAAETVDGERWWPVTADIDGVAYEGYVADGLLRPASRGEAWIDRAIERAKAVPNDLLERLGVPEAVRV